MIQDKIENFLNAPNESISFGKISERKINSDVIIYWGEEPVGKVVKGSKIFLPIAEAFNSEFINSDKKLLISAKLQNWLDNELIINLKPIRDKLADNINSQVRAIAFNCFENLGTFPIYKFRDFIKNIDQENRLQLSKLGIRIGARYFFMPNLMKKKPIEIKSLLWKIYSQLSLDSFLPLPKDGRVSFIADINLPPEYWNSIGYICINNFAFRIDVYEKIFYLARQKFKNGPFLESPDLMNPIGCNSDQLRDILIFSGYNFINLSDGKKIYYMVKKKFENKQKNKKNKINIKKNKIKKGKVNLDPDSPFAVLEKLIK